MAQPLVTELTWENTQFFDFDSKVTTNLELPHQDTMFFDAVSGNDIPNPNQPESEMIENNGSNIYITKMQAPYPDLYNMDPWADRVEDISPMDMINGGNSELKIKEDLIRQKRMGDNNTEGSQAQSTKRFKLNVGFQKHIVSPKKTPRISKSRLELMNASLMQQVEFGQQNLVHREKDYEMMKVAMTRMKNKLRMGHQEFKALVERIAVRYAVKQQ